MTKVIAMYLPQFHRNHDNDNFWGEGYTEWTAVKGSKVLFEGHHQPRVPLNNNYYDLMEKSTMEWQSKLAEKYSIDGFCFYHYWFGKNRKALEKPAENLLGWKDINMPFCFCWDSASWARSWSAIRIKNPWNLVSERNKNDKTGIMIAQDFGDEEYWAEHFYYLLPFFKDSRYIRIDDKPVFMFWDTTFPCFERMVLFWRKLAVMEGLSGLFIIGRKIYMPGCDAIMPWMRFIDDHKKINDICAYDYDELWRKNLSSCVMSICKTYLHGVVRYDDTPRRGNAGNIYIGETPEKFRNYFLGLYQKSLERGNELLFIDAWNEWGEGNYLEPDMDDGYKYLESIKCVCEMDNEERNRLYCQLFGDIENDKYRASIDAENVKLRMQNEIYVRWLDEGINKITSFLINKQLTAICIYGFGKNGKRLYDQLEDSVIRVVGILDRNADTLSNDSIDCPITKQVEDVDGYDAIVVTVVEEYYNIAARLSQKTTKPVLSLYELLVWI